MNLKSINENKTICEKCYRRIQLLNLNQCLGGNECDLFVKQKLLMDEVKNLKELERENKNSFQKAQNTLKEEVFNELIQFKGEVYQEINNNDSNIGVIANQIKNMEKNVTNEYKLMEKNVANEFSNMYGKLNDIQNFMFTINMNLNQYKLVPK